MNKNHALAILLITHILAAIFSTGFHHFDEYFQIWEFAGLKLGMVSEQALAWEYREQIRPWFQPGFTYLSVLFLKLFGIESPFTWHLFNRLLMALLGAWSHWLLLKRYRPEKEHIWYWVAGASLWFLPYIHARTSAENLGLILFCFGLVNAPKRMGLSGFLFGLSFLARMQVAFSVFGLFIFLLLKKTKLKELTVWISAGLGAVALGVLVDYWGYGDWQFTAWEYVQVNLLDGKASHFGVSPFYEYIRLAFNRGIPPVSLVLGALSFYYFYKNPKSELTLIILPNLLIHSLIGHKELRFIFPLLPFTFFMAYEVLPKLKPWQNKFLKFTLGVNFILLIAICFRSANSSWGFYRYVQKNVSAKKIYYYQSDDPFTMVGLRLNLLSPDTPTEEIKDLDQFKQVRSQGDIWVVTKRAPQWRQLKEQPGCQTKYMNYPEWLLKFDYAGWTKRSRVWALLYCPVL